MFRTFIMSGWKWIEKVALEEGVCADEDTEDGREEVVTIDADTG